MEFHAIFLIFLFAFLFLLIGFRKNLRSFKDRLKKDLECKLLFSIVLLFIKFQFYLLI
ncbi:protein of unknown function [Methanocaldococcus lauensis]|nr:protein of unknown function [Methanocaldococcus lauensis]